MPRSATDHRTPSDGAIGEKFTAIVTDFRELCRIDGKPVFQLALDRSCFEPVAAAEGEVVGTLTAISRLGLVLIAPITAVERDDRGELWHTTVKPLQPGTAVVCHRSPWSPGFPDH